MLFKIQFLWTKYLILIYDLDFGLKIGQIYNLQNLQIMESAFKMLIICELHNITPPGCENP